MMIEQTLDKHWTWRENKALARRLKNSRLEELTDDRLQGYLAVTLEPSLRPLMAMETFGAGRIGE